ncbi:MAG: hypothetical protein M1831_003278 [Alyxoria varia]|nr:MAG: hypothetical protein M1831_003278 [Alyxoria varia]
MFYAIEISYDDDFLQEQQNHQNTSRGRRSRPYNRHSRQRQGGNSQRDRQFDAIKHLIFIDGQKVVGTTVPREMLHGGHTATYLKGTVRNKKGRFRFAQLAVDDTPLDESHEGLHAQYEELASIRVELHRQQIKGHKVCRSGLLNPTGHDQPIPEQAYKGKVLSHRTVIESTASNGNQAPKPSTPTFEDMDDPSDPMAQYIFYYRSHRILRYVRVRDATLHEMARRAERQAQNHAQINEFDMEPKHEASAGAANNGVANGEGRRDDVQIIHDGTARHNRRNSDTMQPSRNAVIDTVSQFPKTENSEQAQQLANVLFDAANEPRVVGQRPALKKSRSEVRKELAELYRQQAAEVGQEEADRMMAERVNLEGDEEDESDDDVVVVASRPVSSPTSQNTNNSTSVDSADSPWLFVSSGSSTSQVRSPTLGNGSGLGTGYGGRNPSSSQAFQSRHPTRDRHHQNFQGQYSKGPNAGQKPGDRKRPKARRTSNDNPSTHPHGTVQPRRKKPSAAVKASSSSASKKRRLMEDQASIEAFNQQFADEVQGHEASNDLDDAIEMDEVLPDADQQDPAAEANNTASSEGPANVKQRHRAGKGAHSTYFVDITDSNEERGE